MSYKNDIALYRCRHAISNMNFNFEIVLKTIEISNQVQGGD